MRSGRATDPPDGTDTRPQAPGHRRAAPPALPRLAQAAEPAVRAALRNRRQILLGLGAGAIATSAVTSTVVVLGGGDGLSAAISDGAISPRDAGAFADRDASYVQSVGDSFDLGASGLADTPAAAAAAATATPTHPTPLSRDPVVHLLRRASFGPTRVMVDEVRRIGIDAWIERQLSPDSIPDPVADQVLRAFPTARMTTAQIRASVNEYAWDAMVQLGQATLARQFWSGRQLGRFSDMLKASARDPAMPRYLDNADSHRRAVNENYGRELLELHTVGIDGGYTEKDVRNSAYIMTGRTVSDDGEFRYEADRHWIDPVKVLGFTDKNPSRPKGMALGDRYLQYLATHPATGTNIAHTLAQRLLFQPLNAKDRQALLTFLGAKAGATVRNAPLGGRVDQLVPLILDSVYHALR